MDDPIGKALEGPLRADSPDGWDMFEVGWTELSDFLGLGRISGIGVDAVGLGLAIQCADVKARDIAKTEMLLWRREGRNWRIVEPSGHWFARMLARRPNSLQTWTEFWRMTVMHLELAQNAYILKWIRRDGVVEEMIPILPARCRPRIATNGRLFYEMWAATEFERSQLRGDSYIIVPADRVVHLRGRLWDGLMGLSNVILGSPVFGLLKAINDYQTNLFGNDGKQPLVFETDHVFAGEQADAAFRRLKEQLTQRTRKMQAKGDPILLEAGLKAKPIAINSKDATTTESFNQQVMRVCGLMQIPPHKIFHYESIKYDNQAAADNQYANDCLVPTAGNIEEKLRNSLLPEEEWEDFHPEFDRIAMVAGDPKTMAAWADAGLKNGALEINEARVRYFQVNPIPGGDVRLVPVNMAMVDRDGNIVGQAAVGQQNNDGTAGRSAPRLAVDNT